MNMDRYLREETMWTRGLGETKVKMTREPDWFPPPDYDTNSESPQHQTENVGMENFELEHTHPKRRMFIICCIVIIGAIFLIALIATPTSLILIDDDGGDSDALVTSRQDRGEFFSCFILRRNDTNSSTFTTFNQEFCNTMLNVINVAGDVRCEILRFQGNPTVVIYKIDFPDQSREATTQQLVQAIRETYSAGSLGDIAINNRTNMTLMTDGLQGDQDCLLMTSSVIIESSSISSILSTSIVSSSSVQSSSPVPSTSFYSSSISSSAMSSSLVSTTVTESATSSISIDRSSSREVISTTPVLNGTQNSTAFISPSITQTEKLESSSMRSFQINSTMTPSAIVNFTSEIFIPTPNTTFIMSSTIPSSNKLSTTFMMLTPTPTSITPSCTAHDDGPCEHTHEFDFSHKGFCYIWWNLLLESNLWDVDGLTSYNVVPFQGFCYRELRNLPWFGETRRERIQSERQKLRELFPLSPTEVEPDIDTSNFSQCEITRRNLTRCFIWWTILADAHWETFMDSVFFPHEGFEDSCFSSTFNDTNEALDIMFFIALELDEREDLGGSTDDHHDDDFGLCGCGGGFLSGVPDEMTLRIMMKCWAWWVHVYKTGLWDMYDLASPFMKDYEVFCLSTLMEVPELGQTDLELLNFTLRNVSAQIRGSNVSHVSPVSDTFVELCPSVNSTKPTQDPFAETRDNNKKCYIFWQLLFIDEIWDIQKKVGNLSTLNEWERWCYTKIIDGSFEVEDHHHHHF